MFATKTAENKGEQNQEEKPRRNFIFYAGVGMLSTAAALFTSAALIPEHNLSAPGYFVMMAGAFVTGMGIVFNRIDLEIQR
ncbi:MAG: hypothetical protein ACP5SJ_02230, partial [Candidatus Micrarchaeia archaeon]